MLKLSSLTKDWSNPLVPSLGMQSLNHWTTQEVPIFGLIAPVVLELSRLSMMENNLGRKGEFICYCICNSSGIGIFVVVLVTKSCLFSDPMNCSPPGSPVQGIFQAGILEWVAISLSRGSSWPRAHSSVSCIERRTLHRHASGEAHGDVPGPKNQGLLGVCPSLSVPHVCWWPSSSIWPHGHQQLPGTYFTVWWGSQTRSLW